MEYPGHEEVQGAVGSVQPQFSYMPTDDSLVGARISPPQDEREKRNGTRQGRPRSGRGRPGRDTDYCLRILVPPTMVGAIIGKDGKKIWDLTNSTSTEITVHRKDDKGPIEKVVEICGTPANCTEANLRIHRTMRAETDVAKRSPVLQMRVLVHSGIAGQVIGKGHSHLKHVTEETNVSSVRALREDYNIYNQLDRVITVQCQLDEMANPETSPLSEDLLITQEEEEALLKCSQAEAMVSNKAYSCLKRLMREPQPPNQPPVYMQPSYPGQNMWGPPPNPAVNTNNPQLNNAFVLHWLQGVFGNASHGFSYQTQMPVKVRLTFPPKFAGPVIGKKASYLAFVKKFSGAARVHVSPKERDAPERYIEIIGTPLQQYLAQHCVYCKLAEEGYSNTEGELKLKTEIFIPLKGNKDQPNLIGRFIGKEGQNVRELQRQTGLPIKVLSSNDEDENKEAIIQTVGSFASSQHAQMRILEAIARCQTPPPRRPAQS